MLLLYRGEVFNANFFHNAGIDIDHSFLLAGGGQKTLLVSMMNEALARAKFRGRVAVYADAMKALSGRLRGRTVKFDASSMSCRMAAHIRKFCRMEDYSQELLTARAVKTPAEAAHVRRAVRETKGIFASIDWKAARTEEDLQKQLLMMTLERGLEPAFAPIVSTDANTAYPHYAAGAKKLGSLVLVDYGVRYRHYCADLTRCFIRDGDRKKKEQYERLQDICYFLADALPGLERGKDAAALAGELIAQAGFPKMPHAIGHGVGLDIHEFPRLGPKSDDLLAGATLAIEPSFYLKRYGMRYEETVWFDGKRARIL
ncbi:M24 family metallopeptidase [Candidatus Micrarchaeota archaeon]|nr:M24 family metallopeptidase [Candidatus Micrarchaeota archaeon]